MHTARDYGAREAVSVELFTAACCASGRILREQANGDPKPRDARAETIPRQGDLTPGKAFWPAGCTERDPEWCGKAVGDDPTGREQTSQRAAVGVWSCRGSRLPDYDFTR